MTLDLSKIYLIEKSSLVKGLFYAGVLIAYITSLNPWFLWWFFPYYPIVSSLFFIAAMALSNTMTKPVFTRNDFLLPLLVYIVMPTISMATLLLLSIYSSSSPSSDTTRSCYSGYPPSWQSQWHACWRCLFLSSSSTS